MVITDFNIPVYKDIIVTWNQPKRYVQEPGLCLVRETEGNPSQLTIIEDAKEADACRESC